MVQDGQTVTVSVKWRLLSKPELERDYQIPAGQTLGVFLLPVLAGIEPDEVIILYNGKHRTLTDSIDTDGKIELIPMLCGG